MNPPAKAAKKKADLATGTWRLDPAKSSVNFEVVHLFGLQTVKGSFDKYEGTLNLKSKPAIELTIEANSINTKHSKRDEHLQGENLFHVAKNPQIRFVSKTATLKGNKLTTTGELHAAGQSTPVEIEATVKPVGDGFEIEAVTEVDQRELGLTWNPLPFVKMKPPSKLLISGRLVKA